jgi:cytochrome b involved in lipid metabolism
MGTDEPVDNTNKECTVMSLEEVGKHTSVNDCWVLLHGVVYDVSKYLDEHPGGPEIIQDVAGTDATEEFEDIGHSPEARELLGQMKIGEVVGASQKK